MDEPLRHRALIVRYPNGVRLNHWLLALAFLLAAASGLALFHPALFWLSALLGGGPWTALLHPFIGLIMVALFLLMAIHVGRDNRLEPRDWQWLRGIRDVITNREDRLPEVGRYNGGQKVLFFVLAGCLVLLLLTGLVIWRAYFSAFFPIVIIRAAALLHALAAFLLVCAIIVHVVSGIWVKGSIRAMVRGAVTPGWAWKHHRAWFRSITRTPDGR